MSRRSRVTLTFSVSLPRPVGASDLDVRKYVEEALRQHWTNLDEKSPMRSFPRSELLIRQTSREVVYLEPRMTAGKSVTTC
jgi:hypothetical protein